MEGLFVLLLLVYLLKSLIVLRFQGGWAVALYGALNSAMVPLTWWLNPDWNNPGVLPIGNYVGVPIMFLTVPALSFAIDMARTPELRGRDWCWRYPLEIFLAVPAWVILWAFFEFLVLGWAGNDL